MLADGAVASIPDCPGQTDAARADPGGDAPPAAAQAGGGLSAPACRGPTPGRGGAASRWLDRFRALRDGLAAKPGFRRWATRFPLTRPFARRRARALFDLCAGFVYTQVLLACVRLRVFAILARSAADDGATRAAPVAFAPKRPNA